MQRFSNNTDTIDIEAKAIGIHAFGYDNRGLSIQIRHNRQKPLYDASHVMQAIIVEALNGAIMSGRLQLPETDG